MSPLPTIDILGVRFASVDAATARSEVERLHSHDDPAIVAFANAHVLNLTVADSSYRDVLRNVDLVLNDGKGVMLAARIKGTRFPQDLNGNFFSPIVLQVAAQSGWRVFFLGARPKVAARAAEMLTQRMPGLVIAGTRDGYFSTDEEREVVEQIRTSRADVLMVALGNPRQEIWLSRHVADTGARIGMGVGAFFDFVTEEVPRAPAWVNRIGLEWLFRLIVEPRRLWRRYVLGNPLFLWRVLKERRARGSPSP